MAFAPQVNDTLVIDDNVFHVLEHPAAPGMPYGQEGRQAVVYLIEAPGRLCALKVFRSRFRHQEVAEQAARLRTLVHQPGLQVCQRTVLTPQRYPGLIRKHDDLAYAVLMPWITGPTWMEIVLNQEPLTRGQSLDLAGSLASGLAAMEALDVAHCDLSGPNVILPGLDPSRSQALAVSPVELVDIEQLYSPGHWRPGTLPGGSPGYAHRGALHGLWGHLADRFAGAVLLAEMLAWCDAEIVPRACGESYFDPGEMQVPGARYDALYTALETGWGHHVADLFSRAWNSTNLTECPSFGEWVVALPMRTPRFRFASATAADTPSVPNSFSFVDARVEDAERQEQYRRATWGIHSPLPEVPSGSVPVPGTPSRDTTVDPSSPLSSHVMPHSASGWLLPLIGVVVVVLLAALVALLLRTVAMAP